MMGEEGEVHCLPLSGGWRRNPCFILPESCLPQADPSTAFPRAGDPTVLLLAGSGVRTEPPTLVPRDGLRWGGLLAVSLTLPPPSQELWAFLPLLQT